MPVLPRMTIACTMPDPGLHERAPGTAAIPPAASRHSTCAGGLTASFASGVEIPSAIAALTPLAREGGLLPSAQGMRSARDCRARHAIPQAQSGAPTDGAARDA
jgi:hypothetical protein